ncbi:hypothetical protein NZK35_15000 [Stieleria sp. ICT_E10.1]|uniref:hypothetical protein n=1 Tax=Stieleria sedimenti TaxID=2976331 RepID=UPI0021809003|nr:hypothetical protein [Stieleria sedimenti]MCS7467960.1 hypothetical protein [Stieleria sedimenti]
MITLLARPALWFFALGGFLLHLGLPAGPLAAEPPQRILPLPDVPLPTASQPQDNPAAREALSRALQGDRDAAPLLPDDLQELLRTTGSVLDGSSLDPKFAAPEMPSLTPPPNSPGTQSVRHRRRAAEMLLKSARLLDKIEPKSENQTYLVNQMHQEAVRLLQDPTGSHRPHQPQSDQRARTSGRLPGDPPPTFHDSLRHPPRLTP